MKLGQGKFYLAKCEQNQNVLPRFQFFRHVFCDAFAKGVYGPKFQWLIVGMYDEHWWLKDAPCHPDKIKRALLGAMVMDILPLASSEEITVSAMVRLKVTQDKGGPYELSWFVILFKATHPMGF